MAENSPKFLIKEYKYWAIYINENQSYLGRCVVWCKRDDALDLTDATTAEREELFLVLLNLKRAVSKAFAPDWFNYSFLGNETRHLHSHFIPRYAKSKTFANIVFRDKLYGHKYRTDHSFKTPPDVLKAIQEKIKKAYLNS
jgi:diadenosine tetraphosphate (Ap4A) HIT family hydrolase